MGKIAGPHEINAFSPRPKLQLLRTTVFARGPGKPGMDMEIGDEVHGSVGKKIRIFRH